MIDVILISDATSAKLKRITQNAINTAIFNEKREKVNVYVVESQEVKYDNCTMIPPQPPFNYNKYLNIGARAGEGDYIFFGNNDLTFGKNWASELIDGMVEYNCNSASPICPATAREFKKKPHSGIFRGNEIRHHFAGWAFMWTRKLWIRVDGLKEDYNFWCSDNVAVKQLQKHYESHILVTSSVVDHLGSSTLKTLDSGTKKRYTEDDVRNFNRDYNENIFGWR